MYERRNCHNPRMAASESKARENRLRRMATRQGLRLTKSRSRDPLAEGYGYYWLFDLSTNTLQTQKAGISLDRVENYLMLHEANVSVYQAVDHNLAQQQNNVTWRRKERRDALDQQIRIKAHDQGVAEGQRKIHEARMRRLGISD